MESVSRHQCMIYQGDPLKQLPALAALIHQKLDENYRCLYLNSPSMVSGLCSALAALQIDAPKEIKSGRLLLSSESTLQEDGNFDVDLMLEKLENALDQALDDGYAGLWASGDMTWEFGNKDNLTKLFEYEWQLEQIFHKRPELCGICQYHHDTLPSEILRQGLVSHRTIFINETFSLFNPYHIHSRRLAEKELENPLLDAAIFKLCQSQGLI